MSEQGWLKREIETVRREVAAWPAWKRGEGMDDVKRYKLSQDARYGDGAFVIPAGQVMVREADYDALREQNRVLRKALEELIAAARAVQSAPAVMLVSECSIDANTGEEHRTEVSQDFINALWNEAIDVTDRAQAALTATSQPGGEG